MPPPSHLKKERQKNLDITLGNIKEPVYQTRGAGLLKIHRHGIPEQPLLDFPFPKFKAYDVFSQRARIHILVQHIMSQDFIAILKSSRFFDIRAHHFPGEPNESLHFGEIYQYGAPSKCTHTGQTTNGHAWIQLQGKTVVQWHYCHGGAIGDPSPSFLMSLENYLMYIVLRNGEELPELPEEVVR